MPYHTESNMISVSDPSYKMSTIRTMMSYGTEWMTYSQQQIKNDLKKIRTLLWTSGHARHIVKMYRLDG